MFLIVLSTTNEPIIGLEGLFAIGKILLREERLLVRRHQRQVLAAGFDRRCYSSEASASAKLVCSRRGGTLHLAADIDAVTVTARGGRGAVRAQEHLFAGVLTALARFGECSGYRVNTGTPLYFCHYILTMFLPPVSVEDLKENNNQKKGING